MLRQIINILLVFALILSFTPEVEATIKDEKVKVVIDRTDYPVLYSATPNLEGEAVWLLQARLKELGYDITPSGVYSLATASIVRLFQVASGLEDTGVVDEKTWKALMLVEPSEPCATEDSRLLSDRVVIVIETTKMSLTVYQEGQEVAKYPVALGKSSTPSPIGEWKIVQKSLNWGDGFGTRWLGLNVPWGIYGIHGTNKPYSIGTFASAGCIRMFNRDVEHLYPTIPIGTTVRIVENGKMYPANIKPVRLKSGDSGQRVIYVQSRLKELGYEFDRADGRYGKMTELGVKYYQAWHGLEPSGEMDEATYISLGLIK